MRYLGSKEKLLSDIRSLMSEQGLLVSGRDLVLFDAFCGMGAVSVAFQHFFKKIIINDILVSCITYTRSRFYAEMCNFAKLGFDPFTYLNSSNETREGFFYKNYSPGGSDRKYFTAFNAGRIDFFREKIETWHREGQILDIEYTYLLGCLLEAVSGVANVAGVYGAYLKKWDKRAVKTAIIERLNENTPASLFEYNKSTCLFDYYNEKIENIIGRVECDILYLDPPYTQNQYGTQYHLLETLVYGDSPKISKITGSRPTAPMRSDWSKEIKCHILLDKLIKETKAKYIIMSYSNDGIMSKDYIESVLKRYGKPDTFECKRIGYKKYNNNKCKTQEDHFEYLFYIEKKPADDLIYESPLNYQGNKSKLVPQIQQLVPQNLKLFIDAFGGGFNVGINIKADRTIYNDINLFVVKLIAMFASGDTCKNLQKVFHYIKKYGLSTDNKESYLLLRDAYNKIPAAERNPHMLYSLILYGFQQQLRFNGSHEFNNPFGSRYFNDQLLAKFVSFSRESSEKNIDFLSIDYRELLTLMDDSSLIYLDPPYLNSCGSYNDGKRGFAGWSARQELELCIFCDDLTAKGLKFLLSYNVSEPVLAWAKRRNYEIMQVDAPQGRYNSRREILVKNF